MSFKMQCERLRKRGCNSKKAGRDGADDEAETTTDGERLEAKATRDGADDTKTFESQWFCSSNYRSKPHHK